MRGFPTRDMETICVFCGKFPQEKSKEHVLPQWLIKLTGDPNRIASFGVNLSGPKFEMRRFAFNSLTFPACAVCNNRFARLEANVELVLRRNARL